MRTFVIGSKELSCIILETLLDQGHEVLGVYSRDNEPGMNVWLQDLGHRSLAEMASEHSIPVHYDQKVNSSASIALLESLDLDVIFSCFWSELFKEDVMATSRMGIFNFHTALLPNNRGSRPIPWAIIKGEENAGITLHRMNTGVDDGPMVDQEAVVIQDDDTAASVYEKLMQGAKRMFERSLPHFADGSLTLTEQDASKATYQLRGEPFGGQIHCDWNAAQKDRFKRALTFPPFRAWRSSPQEFHASGLRLSIISPDGTELTGKGGKLIKRSTADKDNYASRLTGGTAEQRRTLRDWAGEIEGQIVLLDGHIDLENHLPMLESLHRRKAACVAVPASKGLNQPFRHQNGLLEVPATPVDAADDAIELIRTSLSEVDSKQQAAYLTLMMEKPQAEETLRLLSKENLSARLNLVGIQEVCNEYDTPYENLSA